MMLLVGPPVVIVAYADTIIICLSLCWFYSNHHNDSYFCNSSWTRRKYPPCTSTLYL